MTSFNIFSKNLPRLDTSSENYSTPKPILNFVKQVWNKGLHIADKIINMTQSLAPQKDPKNNDLTQSSDLQNKEANGSILEKSQRQQKKSRHQIQEAIRKKYKPLPCWLDPNPDEEAYPSKRKRRPSVSEEISEEDLKKQVAKKTQVKKVVVLASPGTGGYMNIDKFLEKIKQIKAEKKARLDLKISREYFTKVQSTLLELNEKPKTLVEMFDPNYKEEKKPTPGEERQKFRDEFYGQTNSEAQSVVNSSEMTDESVESGQGTVQEGPEVKKQNLENSKVSENKKEVSADTFDASSNKADQKFLQTQDSKAKDINKDKEKSKDSPWVSEQNLSSKKNDSTELPAAKVSEQQTPKFNPFMSTITQATTQIASNQLHIQSAMQEMKKKLFGNSSNSTESNFTNTIAKNPPLSANPAVNSPFASNFNSNKPSFMNDTSKQAQSTVPSIFSTQNSQKPGTSISQTPSFQNLPTTSFNSQRPSPQLSNSSPAPQLPFIKSTTPSFMNQNSAKNPFQGSKSNSPFHSYSETQNKPELPSSQSKTPFFTTPLVPVNQNKLPQFMQPQIQTPKSNPFGNNSTAGVQNQYQSSFGQNQSSFGQNQMSSLVKPGLMNDEKNKMVYNSFMASENKNGHQKSGLFERPINVDSEDDWERKTEKRRNGYESRRRERKEGRIRE